MHIVVIETLPAWHQHGKKHWLLTGQQEGFGSTLLHSRDREAESHLPIKEQKLDVLDVFYGVGGTVGGSSTDATASSEQTEQLTS